MTLRPCLDCGRLAKGSRCVACSRGRSRRRDAGRASASGRGYGAAWRRVREFVLARDGRRCVRCGTPGDPGNPISVDHITPKAQGGTDDPGNLRVLCRRCNSILGGSVRGGGRAAT